MSAPPQPAVPAPPLVRGPAAQPLGDPCHEPGDAEPRPTVGIAPVSRLRRHGQLGLGLVLYPASMALILHADLGAMPWDVLQQGLSRRTGTSFGLVTLLVGVVVLLGWIPLRQRPGLGTLANVVVISALIDPALAVVPEPSALPARTVMLVAGVVVNALATACYIGAHLGPGPRDGLMTGLVARTGASVRIVRTAIEVTVVAAGWALGGTLGLGTLLYALAVGPLVQPLLRRLLLPAPAPRR